MEIIQQIALLLSSKTSGGHEAEKVPLGEDTVRCVCGAELDFLEDRGRFPAEECYWKTIPFTFSP